MSAIAPIGMNVGMPTLDTSMQSPELRMSNKKLEIGNIGDIGDISSPNRVAHADGPGDFGKILTEARGLENQATQAADRFAAGDSSMGIHETMIATEKANIALRYAATLKNKVLEAYRELMQTQV